MTGVEEVVVEVPTSTSYDLQEPLLERNTDVRQRTVCRVPSIESLDYEIIENNLFNSDWRSRPRGDIFRYFVAKWTFAFLLGLFTALVGYGVNMAIENISGVKFLVTLSFMNSDREVEAFFIYLGWNLVMVLLSVTMVVYIAPAAAGSGIAEVKAYLNGIDMPDIFSPRTLIIKIVGAIFSNSGGLALGKEGPLMHIGSIIASILGQGGSKKYGLKWKWLSFFKNDRERRDLVTCGIAAGVATAFRAPIGGVMFALEEATSWWRNPLLWRAFFTSATVAVTLKTCMRWCANGACGLFGEGGLILFDMSEFKGSYGLLELGPVVILGILGGIIGSLFNNLNLSMVATSKKFFKRTKRPSLQVLQALLVTTLTTICSFCLPWVVKCKPCPETELECPTVGRLGNFKAFNCPAGHYNDLAGLFFNTNDDAIRNLFSIETPLDFSYFSLGLYSVSMFVLGVITYGVPVPSGLYIPEILSGASYGRMVGMLMNKLCGKLRLDEGIYGVLGAASFLGGSMRMTAALVVILLELTNNLTMLPLIMLVLLISKTIGDYFNQGIFVSHVFLKGVNFLEAFPKSFLRQLTARDAIVKPLIKFNRLERVGTVYDVLWDTQHNGFPVVETLSGSGGHVFMGLVLRQQLLILLKDKRFQVANEVAIGEQYSWFDPDTEFAKAGTGKGLRVEDIAVRPEDRDLYMDLYPVCNTSPYTVVETMSLAKTYTLFRELGLRHLCVLPKTAEGQPLIGILTRQDFATNRLLNLYPHLKDGQKYPMRNHWFCFPFRMPLF